MSKQRLVLTSILILTLTAGLLVLNPSITTNASAEYCDGWDGTGGTEDEPAKISPAANEEPEPCEECLE